MGNRLGPRDRRKPAKDDGHAQTDVWIFGRRPVAEVLRAGRRQIRELRVAVGTRDHADGELAEIIAAARRAGVGIRMAPREDLEDLAEGGNHQGVALLTGSYPYADFGQLLKTVGEHADALVLLLDHIEDPQNVGSLLRTADAAGVSGVILPADRAAGVTAAVARASAGASEHVRVARVVNLSRAIGELKACGCWITGLDAGDAARDYTSIDFKGRCGLVVGNEGRGLGRLVHEQCDFIARLPMLGQVSSLNAGVAGALVMYEVLRQRGST